MKKQITLAGFSALLMMIAVLFIAANTQDEKKQDKKGGQQKEQKQDKGNKGDKDREDNGGRQDGGKKERGNESKADKAKGRDNKDVDKDEKKGYKNDKGNGHDNEGMAKGNKKKDRDDEMKDGYKWDRETFKDRNKYRNGEKVTLCHKVKKGDEPGVTIRVSSNALKSHLNHGDTEGECPAVTSGKRYSDGFLRKRTDYYNTVQNNYEQVSYSRSILDYATQRLTGARQQLVVMQSNNTPVVDIERKQATVVVLEQNVSLLETLVVAAANLVADKME